MINIIKITDYMSEELISLNLKARTKDEVLLELSKLMETSPNISIVGNNVYKSLVEKSLLIEHTEICEVPEQTYKIINPEKVFITYPCVFVLLPNNSNKIDICFSYHLFNNIIPNGLFIFKDS